MKKIRRVELFKLIGESFNSFNVIKSPLSLLLVVSLVGLLGSTSDLYGETVAVEQIYGSSDERVITGVVIDSFGDAVPGVTVQCIASNRGTITDFNGAFELKLSADDKVLQFSFIGLETQEVTIGEESTISVTMQENMIALNEVVAIGYGRQQKSDITGAVSSIKSDSFNQGVVNSPGQMMQGKVSGVNVTSSSGAPGSGQKITIRGEGSIRQGSGPLFVIDGFPVGLAGTGSSTSPLNFLNPEDIESIDILKDASATAIYGSRGANGVILITTKRGKEGSSQVLVSSNISVSNMAKKIPVFSADEFRKRVVEVDGKLEDRGSDTDWQEELTNSAYTYDNNLVLQGGNGQSSYRASLSQFEQQGIVINSGIKRYSARVNATQKLFDDRLKLDLNVNSTIESSENSKTSTLVSYMLEFNPTYPARDESGSPVIYEDLTNPLTHAELYADFKESRRFIVNLTPSFEIIDGLVYKLNFGYENSSSQNDDQSIPSTYPYEEGSLVQDITKSSNTLIENYITYNYSSDNHSLDLLGGHSFQTSNTSSTTWSISKFADTGVEPRFNPGLGQSLDLVENSPSGSAQIDELQSFFGRAGYNYQGKYMVTGTVRADGSSKFGANNRYGIFPSFAAGWRVTEESFMRDTPFDNLKLRFGWGQTGNQEIPSKITQALYTTSVSSDSSYPLDSSDNYPAGTTFVRLANPDIQWEVSTQTNIGLDFSLLKGALSGTVDYFNKVSSNILLEVVPSDPIQPATTYWTNVDDMTITNSGLEIAVDYQHDSESGVSYTVGGNGTFISNVVEDSPFTILTTGSASGSGLTGATINGLVNGYSVGSFYMQEFTGIGSDGLSTFAESEDSGRKIVGSALPSFMYSFYLKSSYKRFNLGIDFNGVTGNKIYNNTAMNKFYKARLANSLNTTSKALEFENESTINSSSVSTRYLENGSFLRLNNMTIGYSFDSSSIEWVESLSLSLTGQNLFVITEYSGFDPEINQDRSVDGVQSFGIDLNGYPKARTFSFGVNITL